MKLSSRRRSGVTQIIERQSKAILARNNRGIMYHGIMAKSTSAASRPNHRCSLSVASEFRRRDEIAAWPCEAACAGRHNQHSASRADRWHDKRDNGSSDEAVTGIWHRRRRRVVEAKPFDPRARHACLRPPLSSGEGTGVTWPMRCTCRRRSMSSSSPIEA